MSSSFLNFLCSWSFLFLGQKPTYIHIGEVHLWYETFGKKGDPALLLIMGGGCQGIMWPTALCERLTKEGFFVIRYDHRDMGLSSSIDYEKKPYDLMDLSRDAIGILDALEIKKAKVVGISMGGLIATLLGAYFPDRIDSIVPIAITSDFSTFLDPSANNLSPLPKPKKECLDYLNYVLAMIDKVATKEEKVALYVRGWEILNGPETYFDKELYQQLITQSMDRMRYPQGYNNQTSAMSSSLKKLNEALSLIQVPTHIIHGTQDPFFSIEHGEELVKSIHGAQLFLFKGMGHNLNPLFYDDLIRVIKNGV